MSSGPLGELMRAAAAQGLPDVSQGASSSLLGGAIPGKIDPVSATGAGQFLDKQLMGGSNITTRGLLTPNALATTQVDASPQTGIVPGNVPGLIPGRGRFLR